MNVERIGDDLSMAKLLQSRPLLVNLPALWNDFCVRIPKLAIKR